MFTKNLTVHSSRGPRMAPSSPAMYAPPAMDRAARYGWALKGKEEEVQLAVVLDTIQLLLPPSHTLPPGLVPSTHTYMPLAHVTSLPHTPHPHSQMLLASFTFHSSHKVIPIPHPSSLPHTSPKPTPPMTHLSTFSTNSPLTPHILLTPHFSRTQLTPHFSHTQLCPHSSHTTLP